MRWKQSHVAQPRESRGRLARLLRVAVALVAAWLPAGCAGQQELLRTPVPEALSGQAQPQGFANIRFWGDEIPPELEDMVARRLDQIRQHRPHLLQGKQQVVFHHLAISGGSSDGAFGAGLLNGWSASGRRPVFETVTGISTGALSAPFAFLGAAYDHVLKEIYTRYSTRQLVKPQVFAGLTGGAAVADNAKLARLVERYVDEKLLKAIAREHEKGRRLFVGTTALDAQRPVIWDMGAIASSGNPQALALFRRVLLASAALPGLFPPVHIRVVAQGRAYEEMHVDGGVTSQVFFLPTRFMNARMERKYGVRAQHRLFVINNGKLVPEYDAVRNRTLPIAARAISTVLKQQGIGDLYRLHALARRDGIDYNLAAVPADFRARKREPFDVAYMRQLFAAGFSLGKAGYAWMKAPPRLPR